MPNKRLPPTSRTSMVRPAGNCSGEPNALMVRRLASANATPPTATAPAITNARDGSHFPATSRNPKIFAGFVMPATIRPSPNTKPATKATTKAMAWSGADHVAHDVDRNESSVHQRKRRDQRAWRQPRQSADTMAAGASARITGANANQESGYDQDRIAGVDRRGGLRRDCRIDLGRQEKPGDERQPPGDIAGPRVKHPAHNPADPRDPAVDEHKQRNGQTDDDSADYG